MTDRTIRHVDSLRKSLLGEYLTIAAVATAVAGIFGSAVRLCLEFTGWLALFAFLALACRLMLGHIAGWFSWSWSLGVIIIAVFGHWLDAATRNYGPGSPLLALAFGIILILFDSWELLRPWKAT